MKKSKKAKQKRALLLREIGYFSRSDQLVPASEKKNISKILILNYWDTPAVIVLWEKYNYGW